jgi:c-di-GMP-binding flagellar brake protein YcgR
MSESYTDRRKHERLEVETAIYVEVVRRGNRSEAENTIIRCETVDISVGGLRIWVPEAIAEGSTLNIAVPMDDWKDNLELVGKAIWTKAADNKEGYWVGLELEDASHEDMENWCKVVYTLKK